MVKKAAQKLLLNQLMQNNLRNASRATDTAFQNQPGVAPEFNLPQSTAVSPEEQGKAEIVDSNDEDEDELEEQKNWLLGKTSRKEKEEQEQEDPFEDTTGRAEEVIAQLPLRSDGTTDTGPIRVLPKKLQYEVIALLKDKRRQRESKRNEFIPVAGNPQNYSSMQLLHFLKDVQLKDRLDAMENKLSADSGEGKRIASDASRQYVLKKSTHLKLNETPDVVKKHSSSSSSSSSIDVFSKITSKEGTNEDAALDHAVTTASHLTSWAASAVRRAVEKRRKRHGEEEQVREVEPKATRNREELQMKRRRVEFSNEHEYLEALLEKKEENPDEMPTDSKDKDSSNFESPRRTEGERLEGILQRKEGKKNELLLDFKEDKKGKLDDLFEIPIIIEEERPEIQPSNEDENSETCLEHEKERKNVVPMGSKEETENTDDESEDDDFESFINFEEMKPEPPRLKNSRFDLDAIKDRARSARDEFDRKKENEEKSDQFVFVEEAEKKSMIEMEDLKEERGTAGADVPCVDERPMGTSGEGNGNSTQSIFEEIQEGSVREVHQDIVLPVVPPRPPKTDVINHVESPSTEKENEAARKLQRRELEKDNLKLRQQKNIAQRDSDVVTPEMLEDVKELLTAFGLPYIEAPMEAEAQCAELEMIKAVDGIVTDDCDAFLFGARNVYKNIFDERKFVEEYLARDVQDELGLDRKRMIHMALLLGSDYTTGIKGIGIVNAFEIVQAFDDLADFRKWVNEPEEIEEAAKSNGKEKGKKERKRKKLGGESEEDEVKNEEEEEEQPVETRWRRKRFRKKSEKVLSSRSSEDRDGSEFEPEADVEKERKKPKTEKEHQKVDDEDPPVTRKFKLSHCRAKKRWMVSDYFPSKQVIEAYEKPAVARLDADFKPKFKDIDEAKIVTFCCSRLGWSEEEAKRQVSRPIAAFKERNTQSTLDSFIVSYPDEARFAAIKSKRMQEVVKGMQDLGNATKTEKLKFAKRKPTEED